MAFRSLSDTTILSSHMDTLNKLFSNVHPKRFAPILSVVNVRDNDNNMTFMNLL